MGKNIALLTISKYKHLRAGIVCWRDAQITVRETPPIELPLMQSVGFIKKMKDRYIVIALMPPDHDLDSSVVMNIPKGMVEKIIWLR